MDDYQQVLPYIGEYINRWKDSPTARRVGDIESTAILSGRAEEWKGVTIDEFFIDILLQYTEVLRNDPSLLGLPSGDEMKSKDSMKQFLDEEKKRIDRVDELTKKMNSYKLGKADPRWHKTSKAREKAIEEFRLTGDSYLRTM